MEFVFSTVYRVTQRDFYARPYTSTWAPVEVVPQLHRDVTTFLDESFPGRWVGRGGPTAWRPKSPDLTPLDIFAWEFINPLPVQFKSLLRGQKGCVFSVGI
jgi:hypothetical protein